MCCGYSQFVYLIELNLILDNNKPKIITIFQITILDCYDLDICGYSKTLNFCHDY